MGPIVYNVPTALPPEDKKKFSITEAAKWLGVKPPVIHHRVRTGEFPKPVTTGNLCKLFTRAQVVKMRNILKSKSADLTTKRKKRM